MGKMNKTARVWLSQLGLFSIQNNFLIELVDYVLIELKHAQGRPRLFIISRYVRHEGLFEMILRFLQE